MLEKKNNINRRVVVTGVGVVSSIGIGKKEFWKNLIAGKSGISEVTSFDTSVLENHRGGEIKNFNPNKFIEFSHDMGRASQLALTATKLAINDAELDLLKIGARNIGIVTGTTMGESQILEIINRTWFEKGEDEVRPDLVLKYPDVALSNNVSYKFNLRNNNFVIPTACSAGNYSIGYGFDLIRRGKSKVIVAGGADAFSRIAFIGFNRLFAMASEKCQPFDKSRRGMMVGEGSGVVILEELEFAQKRNANMYAEILGYGLSCDAYHMTAPSLDGIKKVMIKAMKEAGIKPEEVDYISAHGTGTIPNDKTESQVIKEVFGSRYKEIPVSSIKSMLGHTMGAASAIEAISCCLAIGEEMIPPTINYETPDPECDIDCVPNTARKKELKAVLNNGFAFGGNNCSLILGKI